MPLQKHKELGRWKSLIEEEDWEEDKEDDEEDEGDEEWWNTTTNKNKDFQSFFGLTHSESNVAYSRDFGYGFQKKYCFQQYAVIRLQIWLEVWSLLQ